MGTKCWFVLKEAHYPPPELPANGIGSTKGAICLGHLVPDLRHLDNVINRHGPLAYPADMPVYPTQSRNFVWASNKSRGAHVSANPGIPIPVAAPLSIQLDAGVAFQRSVEDFYGFESLDTFIIQPTTEYIEDSIEEDEAVKYIKQHKTLGSWSLFMITGIKIARGARVRNSETRNRGVYVGAGVEVPVIAEASANVEVTSERDVSSSGKNMTDFVWAVRMAKITKGILDRQWSHETFTKGAVFSAEGGEGAKEQIQAALAAEGFDVNEELSDVGVDDDVFVI